MANTSLALRAQWLRDLSVILDNYSCKVSVFLFVLVYGCENEDKCMLNDLLKTRKKGTLRTTFL